MKKLLITLLMILAIGCEKKYVVAPEEKVAPKEPVKQEAARPEKPEVPKEVVKETIVPKEQKPLEIAMPAKKEAPPAPVAKEEVSAVLRDALFDFDKYNIREDARPVLDAAASQLKKNGQINIIIEGHCDERGTNEYNLALGEKRAKAAKDYLASLSVSPARMTVVTYGEERPLCTEHNETCWQGNRRAHFVVSGK
ncbi:MAG: peptidoglycan-associated lipoprotein Pal [Nitrospirae bacterium]|nr:peptidoglycan-associated lipoprotein Pal [Nitrospirota bacterium]